jgi:hypothetical protein
MTPITNRGRVQLDVTTDELAMITAALLNAGTEVPPSEFKTVFGFGRNDIIPLRRRLSALLGEPRASDLPERFSVPECSTQLKGAKLRPSSMSLRLGDFRIDGELERRNERYRVRVRIRDVEGYDLRDRAQGDEIHVRQLIDLGRGIRFVSSVPTEVIVRTGSNAIELIRAREPVAVRRFLRWNVEPDGPDRHVHEAPER